MTEPLVALEPRVSASPSAPLARYDGALDLAVEETRIARLRFTPPMRAFRPHDEPGEPRTVVIANVAGGVVGGDRLSATIGVGPGAALLATTQAAEKVYRSTGADAVIRNHLSVAEGGVLEMLSSGTILFDGSRFDRSTVIDVANGARASYAETIIFGRIARGEVFAAGAFRDRLRLRRQGRLAWADDLTLEQDIEAKLDAAAGFGGARAMATLLLAGQGSADLVPVLRDVVDRIDDVRAGASALDEETVVLRALASDPSAVRSALEIAWRCARAAWLGRPDRMPTIWAV